MLSWKNIVLLSLGANSQKITSFPHTSCRGFAPGRLTNPPCKILYPPLLYIVEFQGERVLTIDHHLAELRVTLYSGTFFTCSGQCFLRYLVVLLPPSPHSVTAAVRENFEAMQEFISCLKEV